MIAGSASAQLYEDDGISPAYKNGAFRRTAFSVRRGPRGFVVSIGEAAGSYNPSPRKFSFVVKSSALEGRVTTVIDDGKARQVELR